MAKKHNKIKNTGILFEMLIDILTQSIMKLDNVNENKIKTILKTNFNNTELYKEYNLYKIVSETKIPKTEFNSFITNILKERKKIDDNKLKNEKYQLIKHIKENFDLKTITKRRIKNYKLYASVYNLFEYINKSQLKPEIIVSSKNTIKEYVTGHKEVSTDIISEFKQLDVNTRILSYKILMEKFNKKYSNLNNKQKYLLEQYVNSISNSPSLKKYIDKEIKIFKEIIEEKLKCDKIDKRIKIKMKELTNRLNELFIGSVATDNHILNLLRIYEMPYFN